MSAGARRPLTSGAPASEVGGRGGAQEPWTQRAATKSRRAGDSAPARPLRAGRRGWGGRDCESRGGPAPAPAAARKSIFPASPRSGDPLAPHQPQRGPPPLSSPSPTSPFLPGPGRWRRASGAGKGERSASAQVPGAPRRLPLLLPPLPPPGSPAPDRSPPPRAQPAPPGARRAGLGLRGRAERSRREPGCGAHCVKRGASAGRRRGPRASCPGLAGQAGQPRRWRHRGAGWLWLRLRCGRGGGSAEIVAHSF